jgi:AraC-like DNA-binding protein
MYLSINIVRAIVDELMRQGFALETICAQAGVDAAELADATQRLPIDRGTRVVAAATKLSKTDALGLRVGSQAPIGALAVVGHILQSCANMREAVQMFLRYSSLVFEGGGFRIVEQGDEGRFIYEHPFEGSRYERFAAEVSLTVVLRTGIQLSGTDKRPTEVRFRHAAPSYLDEYEQIFGCPVRFGQPANEIVFRRRLLDQQQLHRDDLLCELLRARADQLLADANATERLAERIIDGLKMQLETGAADASGIARRLGMTLRSLQRRLAQSSLSLSRLIDEARRDIACSSLRRSDVAIKDLAHRLGFSEPSAFHRAFKRWTGMTPVQFRGQQGASGGSEGRSTEQ